MVQGGKRINRGGRDDPQKKVEKDDETASGLSELEESKRI